MQLPITINILGTEFMVDKVTAAALPEQAGDSDDCERLIRIVQDMPLDTQKETLLHEVVHMVLALSGVRHALNDKQEESVAQAVGHAVHRLLIDNPSLVAEYWWPHHASAQELGIVNKTQELLRDAP